MLCMQCLIPKAEQNVKKLFYIFKLFLDKIMHFWPYLQLSSGQVVKALHLGFLHTLLSELQWLGTIMADYQTKDSSMQNDSFFLLSPPIPLLFFSLWTAA